MTTFEQFINEWKHKIERTHTMTRELKQQRKADQKRKQFERQGN